MSKNHHHSALLCYNFLCPLQLLFCYEFYFIWQSSRQAKIIHDVMVKTVQFTGRGSKHIQAKIWLGCCLLRAICWGFAHTDEMWEAHGLIEREEQESPCRHGNCESDCPMKCCSNKNNYWAIRDGNLHSHHHHYTPPARHSLPHTHEAVFYSFKSNSWVRTQRQRYPIIFPLCMRCMLFQYGTAEDDVTCRRRHMTGLGLVEIRGSINADDSMPNPDNDSTVPPLFTLPLRLLYPKKSISS